MTQGRNYLRILKEANDAIPGEVISRKISMLEDVIQRIFDTVLKHPDQMGEMEQFMDYYLPTTVKLVNAYRDFDSTGIEGNNIINAKRKLKELLIPSIWLLNGCLMICTRIRLWTLPRMHRYSRQC